MKRSYLGRNCQQATDLIYLSLITNIQQSRNDFLFLKDMIMTSILTNIVIELWIVIVHLKVDKRSIYLFLQLHRLCAAFERDTCNKYSGIFHVASGDLSTSASVSTEDVNDRTGRHRMRCSSAIKMPDVPRWERGREMEGGGGGLTLVALFGISCTANEASPVGNAFQNGSRPICIIRQRDRFIIRQRDRGGFYLNYSYS